MSIPTEERVLIWEDLNGHDEGKRRDEEMLAKFGAKKKNQKWEEDGH